MEVEGYFPDLPVVEGMLDLTGEVLTLESEGGSAVWHKRCDYLGGS